MLGQYVIVNYEERKSAILSQLKRLEEENNWVIPIDEDLCEAIGANGLLARVGCYYHDIGKTKRPQFFIENQMNIENPHDRLPPQTSKNIIIAHATDGADMLRKHRMPKEIIDIAEQHHGTTLLKFFYHKANQNGLEVREEDYRYPGPKAQTKERSAAIDLAGRDVLEAVQMSVNPNVIETPFIAGVAMDGIEVKAKARITVRANIDRLVGGAGEETIVARVGEGIVSTIGSSENHKKVLENPDMISQTVLAKGLDAGTAFEILSIDIADVQ